MLCLPATMLADVEVEFKYCHGAEELQLQLNMGYDSDFSLYWNGMYVGRVVSNYDYDYETGNMLFTYTASLSDSYVGQTIAYISSIGHRGEFVLSSEGNVVELQCSQLTVMAKDDEGNPVVDRSVSLNGLATRYGYTDENGLAVIYVAPGDYTWSWDFGNGTVDLSTDQTLELTAKIEKVKTAYDVKFVCRYGNFPVSTSSNSFRFYVYQDGGQQIADFYSDNYRESVGLTAGTYQIRDDMGGASDKFTIESDTIIFVDYHKVTFTSKSGTTPNVNQNVVVTPKGVNSGYSFYSRSATTNAKGVAELYLLPGEYSYTAAGGKVDFTMGNEDKSIDIETVLVTFNIKCDNLSAPGFSVNGSSLTPSADGKLTYGCLPGAEVTLTISTGVSEYNSITSSSMTVTADVSKTVDVEVYSLMFKSNYEDEMPYIYYAGNNGYHASWNRQYYMLAGTYRYQVSGQEETITLDKNTVIEKNFATLTVNVKDTDGKAAADVYVRLGSNSSLRTDQSGNVVFHCVPGNYTLSWISGNYYDALVSEEITVESDMQTTLTIPAFVSFNIVGLKNSERGVYTIDNLNVGSVKEGENSLRLDPNGEYTISGYHGKTKITNGCTITLGTLSVTSQGNGLAFPMENWDAISIYNVIVGSPVRFSAIPVGNDKFQKWTVNGKDYTDAMIDFKTTDQHTVATAVFSGLSTAVSSPIQTNGSLDFNDSYITLPNEMEGSARIYTLDGKLVKQIGVVGDQIGIYDLPAGAYVLSFQHSDGVINARFVKK